MIFHKLTFKFLSQLSIIGGIHFKTCWYLSKIRAKNEIRGETTIKYQCTGEQNHLMKYFKDAIFLSFVYISGQKIVYLLQMYIILKVSISKVYFFFLKYILFYVFTSCFPFSLSFIDKPLLLCVKTYQSLFSNLTY